jgi:hypothetical protein
MLALHNWCVARLRDAREEGAIDKDTPDSVIEREAERMEMELQMCASTFIDNSFSDADDFDDKSVDLNADPDYEGNAEHERNGEGAADFEPSPDPDWMNP